MFVIADSRFADAEMIQQLARVPRIFAGNQVRFFEHTQCSKCDVFKIANWCSDKVKGHKL